MSTPIAIFVLTALTLTACEATAPTPAPTANAATVASGSPPAITAPPAATPAAAPQAGELTSKPLGTIVAGAASVQVTAREPGKSPKTVDVKDAKTVSAIVAALGPSRTPTSGMPRCLTPYQLTFLDGGGKPLATVGLCDSPGLAEALRSEGRIDVPGGAMAGFTVGDLAALRGVLKPLGIDLP